MDKEKLSGSFHEMWDAFPGMARLINSKHEILAANDIAINKGFIPGSVRLRYLYKSPDMAESICYPALKKDSFSCFRKRSAIGVKA